MDGLREPSIVPPAPVDPTLLPTVIPPALSLVPAPRAEVSELPKMPVAAAMSLAPEALELDLSVLGPSELPPPAQGTEDVVPVVELDEVELDEVRLSAEPSAPRRVAPPLPPPVLRRAR